MNIRAIAAQVVCAILDGASLSDVLPAASTKIKDPRDQAFLQAICYGVCRWYFRLDAILECLLDKPLKEKDQDIYALMLVGLYQLTDMRVPVHASVAETVAAVKNFKKIWAKGLVNAVLRNYLRRGEEVQQRIQNDLSAVYSHPTWMIESFQQSWPSEWKDILIANNQHPPFALRVNENKISRENYLAQLAKEKHEASAINETRSGIVLAQPVDVEQLPGFLQGEVSVQDGAAQLAAELLNSAPEQRVLDACAAPGGKTTHILELEPGVAEVVAVDIDEQRLESVRENLARLRLSAKVICANVANVNEWWDGKLFDRILVDAPCSATGVIRRHPDIKLLRHADDVSKLAKEQLRILNALWPLLKSDGMLVYTTCSILPEENVRNLQGFLASQQDAREYKIKASWGKECSIGRQILPGMHGMDGFYFACLRKS